MWISLIVVVDDAIMFVPNGRKWTMRKERIVKATQQGVSPIWRILRRTHQHRIRAKSAIYDEWNGIHAAHGTGGRGYKL